jgi:hypothetical protein
LSVCLENKCFNGASCMNKELVMILREIDLELGAEEAIKDLKEEYKNLSEGELIRLIEKILELDTEHRATNSIIGIYVNFKVETLHDNEFPVLIGNEFAYKDFLLSVLVLLMFTDRPYRPSIIMDAAFSLLKIDKDLAEQFKDDISSRVYYEYMK